LEERNEKIGDFEAFKLEKEREISMLQKQLSALKEEKKTNKKALLCVQTVRRILCW